MRSRQIRNHFLINLGKHEAKINSANPNLFCEQLDGAEPPQPIATLCSDHFLDRENGNPGIDGGLLW